MQIENFKIFADLVETKSFSKAAKLNGITQSAVSQQARSMERNFKTLMIDRSQKQFNLTREGQRIYEAAKEILHVYEKLESELQEMKKVISGTIRISTIYSIGLHELPPYVKKFLHEFPSVNVRIEYRRSNLVYEDILHNSVDFGLVAFPQRIRQIENIPFRNDSLVLITHPQHPLAKTTEVDIKSLAGHKFIGFDPDIPTRKAVDQIFRDNKLEVVGHCLVWAKDDRTDEWMKREDGGPVSRSAHGGPAPGLRGRVLQRGVAHAIPAGPAGRPAHRADAPRGAAAAGRQCVGLHRGISAGRAGDAAQCSRRLRRLQVDDRPRARPRLRAGQGGHRPGGAEVAAARRVSLPAPHGRPAPASATDPAADRVATSAHRCARDAGPSRDCPPPPACA